MGDPDVWPALLDMSRDDCKRILRRLELEAYSNLVSVLRAQGNLTAHKRRLLKSVAQTLSISEERHKAECRRAVNSEKLATIAMHMAGANTGTEWAIEGRRLVPLLPRLVPQTAFTAIADKVANMAVTEGAKLPLPVPAVKKRLQSPPIDESLLEPNVPEASKTPMVSSASPCPGESSSSPQPIQAKSAVAIAAQVNLNQPHAQSQPATSVSASVAQTKSISPTPSMPQQQTHLKLPLQGIIQTHHYPLSVSPVQMASPALGHTQSQQLQPSVGKVAKQEETSSDERSSRKRSRSASLDASLDGATGQSPTMPPPIKKEALSPLSPANTAHPIQLSPTMSPQSHSHLVQQQTLQAAAAAAAAVSASPNTVVPAATLSSSQVSAPSQLQVMSQLTTQQLSHLPAASQTSTPSSGPRSVTIPTQGTVKLCLGASAPTCATGISPGTHKVIIVSSTAPSILQRSLSVPVVKTSTTAITSLSSPSIPVQAQPTTNTGNGNSPRSVNSDSIATVSSTSVTGSSGANIVSAASIQPSTSAVSSKAPSKSVGQAPTKTRPRANSIVIPVTPNQPNVLGNMSAASMQLKTALQASKQGILKTGDSTAVKILPLSNVPSNAKILPKPAGPGPIYVVSSTSVASQNVSVVTRSVPSGARVMTFTSSSLPRVAVSTSQGGTILSMSPKPVQTLQLAPGNPTSSTSNAVAPKPNVIVVQKGATSFSRGTTLSHASKDVVTKMLLGGKGLSSLSQAHGSAPTLVQASTGQTFTQPAAHVQIVQSPVSVNQSSQSQGQSQTTQNTVSAAPAPRMVTIQKLPSTLVSGSGGTSNVIVFDLSQDQFNNSAVLNEIFATSGLMGSNNAQTVNHETACGPKSTPNTSCSIGSSLDCSDSNIASGDGSADTATGSSPPRTSNTCSDIFSTALSNANLNLNDFLEESSLDGITSTPAEVMRCLSSAENNSNSSHSNASANPTSWVCNENSQNSLGSPDSNQV